MTERAPENGFDRPRTWRGWWRAYWRVMGNILLFMPIASILVDFLLFVILVALTRMLEWAWGIPSPRGMALSIALVWGGLSGYAVWIIARNDRGPVSGPERRRRAGSARARTHHMEGKRP